jgi:hypothetical protein
MTETERLNVFSGFIAHPEFVDEFRVGHPRIETHRFPS